MHQTESEKNKSTEFRSASRIHANEWESQKQMVGDGFFVGFFGGFFVVFVFLSFFLCADGLISWGLFTSRAW